MKRILLTMTAMAGFAAAAPAAAQMNSQVWSGVDLQNRIESLENRLDAAIQSGAISATEHLRLSRQVNDLRDFEARYRPGGFTLAERSDLQNRLMAVRDQVRLADNGRLDNDSRFAWMDEDRRGRDRAFTSADFRDRIYRLESRLNAGVQSRDITRSEEMSLRRQLSDLRRIERQYSYNGLSWQEQRDLQDRLRNARQSINFADGGRFDRDTRYGWNDDRFDYSGRGGPLEDYDACDRGGVAGLVDSVVGRSCLRIGDPVNRGLFAVPYQFRNQFRDSGNVYYRYDGNLIYAIDPRTNRVVSSFDAD